MIPHYKADDYYDWMIQSDQKWVLLAAYSYNNDEVQFVQDWIYDSVIKSLARLKDEHPEAWARSPVYPEVFRDDPDDGWKSTSFHFPKNEEVKGWLEAQRSRAYEGTSGMANPSRS